MSSSRFNDLDNDTYTSQLATTTGANDGHSQQTVAPIVTEVPSMLDSSMSSPTGTVTQPESHHFTIPASNVVVVKTPRSFSNGMHANAWKCIGFQQANDKAFASWHTAFGQSPFPIHHESATPGDPYNRHTSPVRRMAAPDGPSWSVGAADSSNQFQPDSDIFTSRGGLALRSPAPSIQYIDLMAAPIHTPRGSKKLKMDSAQKQDGVKARGSRGPSGQHEQRDALVPTQRGGRVEKASLNTAAEPFPMQHPVSSTDPEIAAILDFSDEVIPPYDTPIGREFTLNGQQLGLPTTMGRDVDVGTAPVLISSTPLSFDDFNWQTSDQSEYGGFPTQIEPFPTGNRSTEQLASWTNEFDGQSMQQAVFSQTGSTAQQPWPQPETFRGYPAEMLAVSQENLYFAPSPNFQPIATSSEARQNYHGTEQLLGQLSGGASMETSAFTLSGAFAQEFPQDSQLQPFDQVTSEINFAPAAFPSRVQPSYGSPYQMDIPSQYDAHAHSNIHHQRNGAVSAMSNMFSHTANGIWPGLASRLNTASFQENLPSQESAIQDESL